MKVMHDGAGYPTTLNAFRFAIWVDSLHEFPKFEQVMGRFHCSRATAQRWLMLLAEARGIERPHRKPGRRRRA